MSDNDQITIEKMIIHKVDHRNYDAPQLSDLESPISEEVASFLRQHIVSNREHKYARTATFIDTPAGQSVFKNMCDELLGDLDQFTPQSRSIANHLFQTVAEDRRISPSDLVICTFSERDENARWLAMLKLDPEDGFVGEREIVDGLVRIVLRRIPDVLPTGELQKCAFILPQSLREIQEYDLKVLDQQAARYGARRLVASFFIKDFLQCKVGLNRKDRTITFVRESHQWVKKKMVRWPQEDIERFKRRTTDFIKDDVVDLTSFAQAVIPKPDERDEYLKHMLDQGLEELTFEPDPEERHQWTKYTCFEGDDGLRVRIEANAIGPGKTLNYEREKATNTWTVTIRTIRWEETPRRGGR